MASRSAHRRRGVGDDYAKSPVPEGDAARPYKVVATEPGLSYIADRVSGEDVGYLVQNFHGDWKGYLVTARGVEVAWERRRDEAAAALWAAYRKETQ